MGNSHSNTERIDEILNKLSSLPSSTVAAEIIALAKDRSFKETEFDIIANKIYEKVWRDRSFKCANLVLALKDHPIDARITFQDLFINNASKQFDSLQDCDAFKAQFFAELYDVGLVSNFTLFVWITVDLLFRPWFQDEMLRAVKDTKSFERNSSDYNIQTLREMITSRNLILADNQPVERLDGPTIVPEAASGSNSSVVKLVGINEAIDKILDKLPCSPASFIVTEIVTLANHHEFTEQEFTTVARKIYERAWRDRNFKDCTNLILALKDQPIVNDPLAHAGMTFRDVFIINAREQFDNLQEDEAFKAKFFAQLYEVGFVSNYMFSLWLTVDLRLLRWFQNELLIAIKNTKLFQTNSSDYNLKKLRKMMVERNILPPDPVQPIELRVTTATANAGHDIYATTTQPQTVNSATVTQAQSTLTTIEKVLDNYPNISAAQIAREIAELPSKRGFKSEEFTAIASKLFELSWRDDDFRRFTSLVPLLSGISYTEPKTKNVVTFKDVFLKFAMQQFDKLKSLEDPVDDAFQAKFFARLFLVGSVSSTLVIHWIKSLAHRHQLQYEMLVLLKEKVQREDGNDKDIAALRLMIQQIIGPDLGENVPRTEQLSTPKRADDVSKSEFASHDDFFIKASQQLSTTQNPAMPTEIDISADFRYFLTNFRKDEQTNFNFDLLKTCSDGDRQICAEIFVEYALTSQNDVVVALAKLARTIQYDNKTKRSRGNKTFIAHLSNALKKTMNQFFNETRSRKFWRRVSTIGVFIGHLYVLECIEINLLCDWLSHINVLMREGETNASKLLLNVLRIVLSSMKKKHPNQGNFYQQQVLNLSVNSQVPSEFLSWVNNLKKCDDPMTMNAKNIETFGSNSPETASSSKPIKAKQPFTEQFRDLLNNIDQRSSSVINLDHFKTCSNDVRQDCAKILLEKVLIDPKNIERYAQLTKDIVNSHSESSTIHATFLVHLLQFCSSAMDESFKKRSVAPWHRMMNLGAFLTHLHQLNCLKSTNMISTWLTEVSKRALRDDDLLAPTCFLTVMKNLSGKLAMMKNFKLHLQQLYQLSVGKKIPLSFKDWADQTLQHLQSQKRILSESSQDSKGNIEKTCESRSLATGTIKKTVPQPPKPTFTAEFQKFLNNIDQVSSSVINLDHFKTCSTDERRNCAQILFQKVLTDPKNIERYSKLIKEIATSHSDKSTSTVSFLMHVMDICYLTSDQSFKEESNIPWQQINVIGIFLAQLHRLGCLQSSNLITRWLTKVAKRALAGDTNATKSFLTVLETAWKESIFEESQRNLHLDQLHLLSMKGIIPENFQEWAQKALQQLPNETNTDCVEPRATNVQISTGAIRKTTLPQPETAAKSEEEAGDFSGNIAAFKSQSFTELDKSLDKFLSTLKTRNDMIICTRSFCEALTTDFDFIAYAKLAQLIESKIKARNSSLSFINELRSLLWKLWIDFLPLKSITEGKKLRDVKNLVKILGEFYRIQCIRSDQIFQIMQTLSKNENFLESLRILVQVISTTLISNGEREICRKFLGTLQTKQKEVVNARSALVYQDLVGTFADIVKLLTQTKIEQKQIEEMFAGLTMECVPGIAKSIKLLCLDRIDLVVDALISNATKAVGETEAYAELASELQDMKVDGNVAFKDVLADKCTNLLKNNLDGGEFEQLAETLNLLDLIAGLFLINVLPPSYLLNCIELIEKDKSGNAADYLSSLIIRVGEKLEKEDSVTTNKIYEKFKSKVYDKYPKLDGSNQSKVYDSKNELDVVDAKNYQCTWDEILRNPSQVKLCAKAYAMDKTKHNSLVKFIKSRVATFTPNSNTDQLESVMSFICELYLLDVTTDVDMESLLLPAKYLEFHIINKLVASINPKVSTSKNRELQSLLASLEDSAHDQFMQFLRDVKDDIGEINKIIDSKDEAASP